MYPRTYAGIGSRKTPVDILICMTILANMLEAKGLILRSGAAGGADAAFEAGVLDPEMTDIYVPWNGFGYRDLSYPISPSAMQLAEAFHPNWEALTRSMRFLMARNGYQILGPNLNDPVEFVACWTPDGCETMRHRGPKTGGTGQAIAIANYYDIPVYNLKRKGRMEALMNRIKNE